MLQKKAQLQQLEADLAGIDERTAKGIAEYQEIRAVGCQSL